MMVVANQAGHDDSIDVIPNENTHLLPKPSVTGNGLIQDEESLHEPDAKHSSTTKLVTAEFFLLLKGSVPVILAYTLQNSLQTISVLIVGRSSPEHLAVAAFSYMFAMCSAWLIALGGTTALDTLASSSFTGSENKHDLGVLLQRGFIILGLFYIPVAILWACSESFFRLLGQNPDLSRESARFLTCLIPGGLGYIYFEAMKKYLQAQGLCQPTDNAHEISPNSHQRLFRNHAAGYLCSSDHITDQRWSELPVLLHLQYRIAGSTSRDQHIILDIFCTPRALLALRGWV